MKSDQARVKELIECTIVQLCQKGLRFNVELKIQGLVVVTVDKQEMFVAQVDFAEGLKRKDDDDVEVLPVVDLTEQEGRKRVPATPRTPSTPRSCSAVNGNKTPKNLFSPRLYSSPQQFPSPRSSAGGLQRTPTGAARSRLAVDRPPRPAPSTVMVIEDDREERDDVVILASQSHAAAPTKSDTPCRRLSQSVGNSDVMITERSDRHFNNDDVVADKWPSHHLNNELVVAEGKSLQLSSDHLNASDVMIEKRACRSVSCRSNNNNDEVIVTESWPSVLYESIGNRGTVAERMPASSHSDHFSNASAILAEKRTTQTPSGYLGRNYPFMASQSSNRCSPKVTPAVSQNPDHINSEKPVLFSTNGTTGTSTHCIPVSGVFKNSQADLPCILPTMTTTCCILSSRPPITSVITDSSRCSMICRNPTMTSSTSKTTAVTNAPFINSLPACSHSTTVNPQFAPDCTTVNCSSKHEKYGLTEETAQNCHEKKTEVDVGNANKRKFSELSGGNNNSTVLQQSSAYRDVDHASRVCMKANALSLPQKDFVTREGKDASQILGDIKFTGDLGQPECNKGTLQYEAERVEVVPRPRLTFVAEPGFEKSLYGCFSGDQSSTTIDEIKLPFVYTDIADSNGIDSRLTLVMDADDESTEAGQLFTPFHCKFPGCVGSYVDNAQLANHYSIMHTDSLKLCNAKDPDVDVKTEPRVVRSVPVQVVARSKFSCPSKTCGFSADVFAEVSAHHRQAHSRSISPRVRQQMLWKSRLSNVSAMAKGMPGLVDDKVLAPGLEVGDVVSFGDASLCANDTDGSQSSKRALYGCLSLDNRCSWTTADYDELLLHMEQVHCYVVKSAAAEAAKTLKQEPRE